MKIKLTSIIRLKTGSNHEWEDQLGIVTDMWTKTKNKIKVTTYRVAVETSRDEKYRASTFEVTGDKLELVDNVKHQDLSPYVIHKYAIDRGHAKRIKFEKRIKKIGRELFDKYLTLLQRSKDFKVVEDTLLGEWSVAIYRITNKQGDEIEVRRGHLLSEGFRLADFYNGVDSKDKQSEYEKYIGKLLKLMNATGRAYEDEKASGVKRYLKGRG